jgi:dienelactone hydrolase
VTEAMRCRHGDTLLEGQVEIPTGVGPFPAVLVVHSGLGIDGHIMITARRLAEAGYLAVAVDMYGVDADTSTPSIAGANSKLLIENPELLRERMVTWFGAIAARDDVASQRVAAIGYCLGGLSVLELARSGADVQAVVCYHGVLTTHAPAQPGIIKGAVAVYSGDLDPWVPLADIDILRRELRAAEVCHQITTFGGVKHGFSDPDASRLGSPDLAYDALADKISWAGMLALFEQTISDVR